MEFKPGINFRITGTIKRMEVLERGNCLVTISTSAEGQMRDVRIRFFEVAKVLLYRVRDRIQVDAHMQIRRSMQGDRRAYRPELIGDTVTLIQRRLSSAIGKQYGSAGNDEPAGRYKLGTGRRYGKWTLFSK
ncbi:MAG: hypothetical protein ACLTX3_06950 [Lachnospiraceae bacterium]